MNPTLIDSLESLLGDRTSAISRDLKLNLRRVLENGALDEGECILAILASATALNVDALAKAAMARLENIGLGAEEIREARESAALMGMLNVYYRFRHQINDAESYGSAGLRMTAMARPTLGKERFEMLAFTVSVINGCANCVVAHEKTLRETGVAKEKIHELARIASIMKAIEVLLRVN